MSPCFVVQCPVSSLDSFAIISLGRRELVGLLLRPFDCECSVSHPHVAVD